MIDWLTGIVGYSGELLKLNKICELTPVGEIIWTSERKLQVRGSFDASVQLGRAAPTDSMLMAARKYDLECMTPCLILSGNPSKFLQGHNVFGPSVAAMAPVVQAVIRGLPGEIRPADADSELWPALHRSRVDITTSVDMGSHKLVHEWLRTAETSSRSKHRHGRALVSGDTVYWGKTSRRWTLKAYCKFCELREHGPGDLALRKLLMDYCEGQLRLELTLRGMELKDRGTLDESLIWDFFERIEVGVLKADLGGEQVKTELSYGAQFTLSRWIGGEDVRHSMPLRTFWYHRRRILDVVGVDISLKYEKKQAEAVVFDLDYLRQHEIKLLPAQLQGLLFKPGDSPRWVGH
jgi:phage/plasmid replication protein, gene II/X family